MNETIIEPKKKRQVRSFVLFLAVMLIMTFVSRMIYTRKLVVVNVEKVQEMRLAKRMTYSGTLEATAVKTVYLPDGLTVEKVTAAPGSKVEKDGELMKLDMEQLGKQAKKLEREIDEEMNKDGLSGDGDISVFTEADLPIKSIMVKTGDAVKQGDVLFTVDRDLLLRLINELENERNGNILDRRKSLEAEPEVQSADGKKKTNYEAEALKMEIEQKQKKIDRYLNIYRNGGKISAPCEGTITGITVKPGSLTGREAAVLIGTEAHISGNTAEKQERLAELKELIEQEGSVKSPSDGIVTSSAVSAGGQTPSGAAMCISDDGEPMLFSADISDEDAALISVGDSADLSFRGGKIDMSSSRIAFLTKSPSGTGFRLTIPVESEELCSGENGELTITPASRNISPCVPNLAVKGGKNNKCVYLLRKEEGFLGEEYHAERVSVTARASNENYTALDNVSLSKEDLVICTDKELKDDQIVRVR